MAYGFNDDKSKADISEIYKLKDITKEGISFSNGVTVVNMGSIPSISGYKPVAIAQTYVSANKIVANANTNGSNPETQKELFGSINLYAYNPDNAITTYAKVTILYIKTI